MNSYRIDKLEDVRKAAQILSKLFKKGVVFLSGDLGSGKTTFVQFFLKYWGYKGVVNSPSYALMNYYEVDACTIIHADLYRLLDDEELLYLDVHDWVDMAAIIFIEWAEQGEKYLPPADLICRFTLSDEGRTLQIQANTMEYEWLLTQFGVNWEAK